MNDKVFGCVHNHLSTQSRCVIAYSGGVDSHVLLHAVWSYRQHNMQQALSVQVVHVNHQLQAKAQAWVAHCQAVCAALDLSLQIETLDIELKSGDSLEEKAREARYTCLKKYMDTESILLTAHNSNDQAETFLLQALRGAGPKGLSAMPAKREFGAGYLHRPFLNIKREEILDYAKRHHLQWIEDDSNTNMQLNRNYVRRAVFPLLQERFPGVMESFVRAARLCSEQEMLISEIADVELGAVMIGKNVVIEKIQALSLPRQRMLLRAWLRTHGIRMPNEKHLKQIQKDVLQARLDAHPVFQLPGVLLYREQGQLKIRFLN